MNQEGDTALHLAASDRWDAAEGVIVLLDAGADPLRKNSKGQIPLDIAVDNEALDGSDAYQRLRDADDAPPLAR